MCAKKSYCLVANLNQNPGHRPIISTWLPALLKAGCMWLIARGPDEATEASCSDVTEEMIEERWLLPKEFWFNDGQC